MEHALTDSLFRVMCASYAGALGSYVGSLASPRKVVARAATGLALLGLAIHTAWLGVRWYQSGVVEVQARASVGEHLTGSAWLWTFLSHPPYTNLYEGLVFVAWCLMLTYLVVEARFKLRAIGVLATGLVLVALVEAFIVTEKAVDPLVPALQSWWLLIHVALLFVAYALFLLAAAVAILYLVRVGAPVASLGLGFTAASALVLLATGGAKGLLTRLSFDLTPLAQHAGKWQAVHYFPDGAEKAVRLTVPVAGVGPLVLLAVVLFVGAAVAWGLERRSGQELGVRGPAFKVTLGAVVCLAAALAVLLFQVLLSGEVTPGPVAGRFPPGVAPPFKLSFQSNFGLGLLVLALGVAAVFAALVRWREPLLERLPDADRLDHVVYRLIVIAFPMLSFGIVMGALWAYDAWGRYWGWDPKETWSLITWFVYAVYLHTRVTMGWSGRPGAVIAVVGFAFVIFTYMGVNLGLTGEGLHSYGAG